MTQEEEQLRGAIAIVLAAGLAVTDCGVTCWLVKDTDGIELGFMEGREDGLYQDVTEATTAFLKAAGWKSAAT